MKRLLAATAITALSAAPVVAQSVFVLDDIIFSAYADGTESARVGPSVEVIEGEELEALGDTQLSEALRSLAGVSFAQGGPPGARSQVTLRGGGPEYVSDYVDGILVTDPSATEMSFDNFGGLTTGSIRRIELLRGSQSALYGGTAVAGVISITTIAGDEAPEGTAQSVTVQGGSYGTAALDYTLTQRTGDLLLSLGASHVEGEGFSAGDENNGNTEADPFRHTRLSFGAEYAASESLTIGLNGFLEEGRNEIDEFPFVGVPNDGTPGDDFAERAARGLRVWAEGEAGAWSWSGSVAYYTIDRKTGSVTVAPGNAASPVASYSAERTTFDASATREFGETWRLSFGADARLESATYSNLASGTQDTETIGGFVEATWSPTADLDITGTLRFDEHSNFGSYPTGRLAFVWRPTEALRIRGAAATGYRAPSLDELYGAYPAFPFFGNPDLTPEESESFEIGFDYTFAGGAEIGVTAFHLNVSDLITYVDCPRSPPLFGCDPLTFGTLANAPGTSERSGVELTGMLPVSDAVTLTGAYTYTEARNAAGARLNNVPRHDLAFGLDADLSDRLHLAASAQYVADRANGSFDPQPYTDYTVVDTTFTYDLGDEVEVFLRIENLFDEEYQTVSGFGTSDRAFYLGLRAAF
jgi:vitamin B12 transporter